MYRFVVHVKSRGITKYCKVFNNNIELYGKLINIV